MEQLLRKKVLESAAPNAPRPTWGQEVTVKMQGVLEDRTVVEKDPKLVFVIGEGDVNQVKSPPISLRLGIRLSPMYCSLNANNSATA